jgi:hypothetical protein
MEAFAPVRMSMHHRCSRSNLCAIVDRNRGWTAIVDTHERIRRRVVGVHDPHVHDPHTIRGTIRGVVSTIRAVAPAADAFRAGAKMNGSRSARVVPRVESGNNRLMGPEAN